MVVSTTTTATIGATTTNEEPESSSTAANHGPKPIPETSSVADEPNTTTTTIITNSNNNNKNLVVIDDDDNDEPIAPSTLSSSKTIIPKKPTTTNNDNNNDNAMDDDDDEDYFADVGFMFEGNQPTRLEQFEWAIQRNTGRRTNTTTSDTNNTVTTTTTNTTIIRVAIHCADDIPGAVQSGHYLWPGARYLVEYMIDQQQQQQLLLQSDCSPQKVSMSLLPFNNNNNNDTVVGIIELGAGCALASLVALQLYHETLQCIVITDHDPGTLVRANDNYEITLQQCILNDCAIHHSSSSTKATTTTNNNNTSNNENNIDTNRNDTTKELDHNATTKSIPQSHPLQERELSDTGTDDDSASSADERLNSFINTIASIPVLMEPLEWGCDRHKIERIWNRMSEHITFDNDNNNNVSSSSSSSLLSSSFMKIYSEQSMYLILGSDLIYCVEVVRPLFHTVYTIQQFVLDQSPLKQQQQQQQPKSTIRFLLSQSFEYDERTEQAIDDACSEFHLTRTILIENTTTNNDNNESTSFRRIQEFVPNR